MLLIRAMKACCFNWRSGRLWARLVPACLGLGLSWQGSAQAVPEELQAVQAGLRWLEEVDAGRYEAAWRETAEMFREGIGPTRWGEYVGRVRSRLQAVQQREVGQAIPATQLPEAPPGDYVLLRWQTQFAGADEPYDELLILRREEAGGWAVCGYYLQPTSETEAAHPARRPQSGNDAGNEAASGEGQALQ